MSKVDIQLEGVGGGTFRVDGHDIAPSVRAFRFSWTPGSVNTVIVELNVVDATRIDGDFEIWLDPQTRDLLMRAGWTPPASGGRFELDAPTSSVSEPMPAEPEATAIPPGPVNDAIDAFLDDPSTGGYRERPQR